MSLVGVLQQLGGVATRAQLLEQVPRSVLDQALATGLVERTSRGRFALPECDASARQAHELHGVLCLTSAALHHGWAVKQVPESPHVVFGKRRNLTAAQRSGITVHRANLTPDDIDGVATSPEKTLEMCLRSLPPDEALCVADSALRSGFGKRALLAIARDARGPGGRQLRQIAALADERAANPFESVLRWLAAETVGLNVVPQKLVTGPGLCVTPDLVDEDLMIVLEADSFEWHGGRAALRKDCRRYDELVINGWLVLRFAWEDVMFDDAWVREVLRRAVALRSRSVAA